MFGIGGLELVIIIVFALLIFGPDKMPEIGKMLGKGLRMFQDAKQEVETTVKTEVFKPEDAKMLRQVKRDYEQLKSSMANPQEIFKKAPVKPRAEDNPSEQQESSIEREPSVGSGTPETAQTQAHAAPDTALSVEIEALERQLAEIKQKAAAISAHESSSTSASEGAQESRVEAGDVPEPHLGVNPADRTALLYEQRSKREKPRSAADDIWDASTSREEK